MTYSEICSGLRDLREVILKDTRTYDRLQIAELDDENRNFYYVLTAAINVIQSIETPKYLSFKNLVDHGLNFIEAGERLCLPQSTITRFRNTYLRSLDNRYCLPPENPFEEEVNK